VEWNQRKILSKSCERAELRRLAVNGMPFLGHGRAARSASPGGAFPSRGLWRLPGLCATVRSAQRG
jgi:hypothetical protein